MRRRLAFSSTLLAIFLAFLLPALTVASTFEYEVKRNTCSATGGAHGFGHLYFKVKLQEYGNSGANKFTFTAKAQHKTIGSNKWVTDWNAGTYVYTFPSNSSSYWYTRWWTYDPNDYAWHRFLVTLKVWHGSSVLASRTLTGKIC